MKVLFIDNEERLKQHRLFQLILKVEEKIESANFEWDNGPNADTGKRIKEMLRAIKEADCVFIHFGSMPRDKASQILSEIKEKTSVRVIVNSASPLLFEKADCVLELPALVETKIRAIKGFDSQ
ncbi:MAG: hypothetical protein HYS60_00285 [Candidatus Wildermuthbacteria bacterium]|nr:hypothetical protein [Candidatus Wildermuthbacteria bacterium]